METLFIVDETITIVSPLELILYNVTLIRSTEFSASQIQK